MIVAVASMGTRRAKTASGSIPETRPERLDDHLQLGRVDHQRRVEEARRDVREVFHWTSTFPVAASFATSSSVNPGVPTRKDLPAIRVVREVEAVGAVVVVLLLLVDHMTRRIPAPRTQSCA